MAARFNTNYDLIKFLRQDGSIVHNEVEQAMLSTDRGLYSSIPSEAYINAPHSIGYGATISQPAMHAACLELLFSNLYKGANVMDVGCGSGYLTTVMSELVGENGRVLAIDYVPELVELSINNIKKDGNRGSWLGNRITVRQGDGWKGDPTQKFDAIHVGAAAQSIPQALIDQLKNGGRMIIPVGTQDRFGSGQHLDLVEKSQNGEIRVTKIMDVRYVPLVKLD